MTGQQSLFTKPVWRGPSDAQVLARLPTMSTAYLRGFIRWNDYLYWVKNAPELKDTTFDAMVREYERREGRDRFLDELGMW